MPFYFYLIALMSNLAMALDCPTDTYLVEFTSPVSNEKKKWCQKNVGGAYIKHGPEETLMPDGSSKREEYLNGKLMEVSATAITAAAPVTAVETESPSAVIVASDNREIPMLVRKDRPASFNIMPGGGFKVPKPPATYMAELQVYALTKLTEVMAQGMVPNNEFAYAFSQIPGMDNQAMKKIAAHYLALLPTKLAQQSLGLMEVHPLGLLFNNIRDLAKRGDIEMLRLYLDEFNFPPDYYLLSFPPMVNIIARYSKVPKTMLAMIAAKKIDWHAVARCGFEKTFCSKTSKQLDLTCTPMDAAALEGNVESLAAMLGQGVSPNGNATNIATPLAFALHRNHHQAFQLLLDHADIDLYATIKSVACHFVNGNIMGNTLARHKRLDYVDRLIAKGFKPQDSRPDVLSAAINQDVLPDFLNFPGWQKFTMERLNFLQQKNISLQQALAGNDTIIRSAIGLQFYDVLTFLMDHKGIDINQTDANGRSPIFYAFESINWPEGKPPAGWKVARQTEHPEKTASRLKIIQYVFDHGGKRQLRDKYDKGLIHYATLELPFSQPLLDLLNSKDSY